ncbi:MAG: dihydropteroate synthase [Rubricoccaceae bacterium]|nr:dihydropteroate synthase [Rubricoccaceae bacterium]
MGILNITPDSFSDGGRYDTIESALIRAEQMLNEGAAIIDVGGESTRPQGTAYGTGATAVSADEEIRRVIPIIEQISQHLSHALISVDTYKGEVARAALRAGAHIVNDVTGLRQGIGTARAAADFGAPLVVMHAVGKPGEMSHEHTHKDVVAEVVASLRKSLETAKEAGVKDVVIDPGFGFGKSVEDNLRLIAHVDRFVEVGSPVLIGISRKSSVGKVLGSADAPTPVHDRLFGTLGLTAMAMMKGASIVRTHDVKATVEMLGAIAAAQQASRPECVS